MAAIAADLAKPSATPAGALALASSGALRDVLRDGGLGPQMIVIAGACFVIGSPATESGRESDENQQRMCVAPFALGQCEVTLEDYAAFRAATGRAVTASSEHACLALAPSTGQWTWQREGDSGSGEEARAAPVRCISWHHAQGYAG